MRVSIGFAIVAASLLAGYFYATTRTDTYLGRWFAWKASDVDDHLLFPSRVVANAPPQFVFTSGPSAIGNDTFRYRANEQERSGKLSDLLEANDTHAFIIAKDDRIAYEAYFNGYRRDSILTSFSVAKSVTSLLIGAAIDAGKIKSIDDPVTNYVPELATNDPRYGKLTLRMLLDMRSGIAFADHDLPWGDKPRAYYDPNLRQVALSRALDAEPDTSFQYNSYNPILVGVALERATGMSNAAWLQTVLWSRLGMEFPASWSIDSKTGGMEKMESGINARAIDFLKIGRLMLERGAWNGRQVISPQWIAASAEPADRTRIPEFGAAAHYQRGWWVTARSENRLYSVAATGHLGQFIFVYPDQNVVMVRFGSSLGEIDRWSEVFDNITRALSEPSSDIRNDNEPVERPR